MITTEEWITKARGVHGDKFDYSEVSYTGTYNHVSVKCIEHDKVLTVTPKQHLKTESGGCPDCSTRIRSLSRQGSKWSKPNPRKKTTEQFIEESKALHGDKYGYDRCVYQGTAKQVELWCNTCKKYFKTYAGDHVKKDKKTGCKDCGYRNRKNRESETTYDVLVKQLSSKYDLTGYEIINDKELYPSRGDVSIYCKKHDTVNVKNLNDIVRGRKAHLCKECFLDTKRTPLETLEAQVEAASKHFNGLYDYSKIDLNHFKSTADKITIGCPRHGDVRMTWFSHFILHQACNKCSKSYTVEQVYELIETMKKPYINTKSMSINTNGSNFVKSYMLENLYCTRHKTFFDQTYNAFRDGFVGCPECNTASVSEQEKSLRNFVSKLIDIEANVRPEWLLFDSKFPKELDIFIPELNLAIEYNGTHYHSVEFNEKFLDYHKKKYEACLKNGINLIHIFEFEDINKWKKRLYNYIKNPDKYSISFDNSKRTIKGYTCYGKSKIRRLCDR